MRYLCFVFLTVALVSSAHADQPVYTIQLRATASFTPDTNEGDTLRFYAPRFPPDVKLQFAALGYSMPIAIRSNDPALAIQEIADQIAVATREPLGKYADSISAAASKPNFLLAAHSERASVVLLLVPKGEDRYALICSYRFQRMPSQPVPNNAESRGSAGDSLAPESSSAPAPRG